MLHLHTFSNKKAQDHFQKTVLNTERYSAIKGFLIPEQRKLLRGRKELMFWGVKPYQKNKWISKSKGDKVLFYCEGEIKYTAEIEFKFRNGLLANRFWKKDVDGTRWEYMFTLINLQKSNISLKELNSNILKKTDGKVRENLNSAWYGYTTIEEWQVKPKLIEKLSIKTPIESFRKEEERNLKISKKKSFNKLKKDAKKAKGKPSIKETVGISYSRNQDVVRYVKDLANGVCDLCNEEAPFTTKNGPFLECHHIKQLSDKGDDTVKNAVALCPNCHRKMHYASSPKLISKLKRKVASRE